MVNEEHLKELLTYDTKTGKLFWKARPPVLFVSDWAYKVWNKKYSGKEAFTCEERGYKTGRIYNKHYLAHRVVWALNHGKWPEKELDHINGSRLDNRLENLREVTSAENSKNMKRPRHNTSGVCGVYFENFTGSWVASAESEGRRVKRRCNSFEEAVVVRKQFSEDLGFHINHGRN